MTGEVLRAAEHAFGPHPPHKGRRQGRCGAGVFPPGPHVDHGIGGVVVDIADRAQHPVEAEGPGFAAGAAAMALGQGAGLLRCLPKQPSDRQRRRQPARPLEALAHALLYIGAEQQGQPGPALQLLAAQRHLRGTAPQQDDPTDPLVQQLAELGVGELPLGVTPLGIEQVTAGPHHQQGRDQAPQAGWSVHLRARPSAGVVPRACGAGPARWCLGRGRGQTQSSLPGCGAS